TPPCRRCRRCFAHSHPPEAPRAPVTPAILAHCGPGAPAKACNKHGSGVHFHSSKIPGIGQAHATTSTGRYDCSICHACTSLGVPQWWSHCFASDWRPAHAARSPVQTTPGPSGHPQDRPRADR
ncbi:hypothetical protein OY671_011291, partial [Metschnikowia pulcherrima]